MLTCLYKHVYLREAATSTVRVCFQPYLHINVQIIVYLHLHVDAGAYIVNNARGAICDHGAIVRACESGQIGGALLVSPVSLPGMSLQAWHLLCPASICPWGLAPWTSLPCATLPHAATVLTLPYPTLIVSTLPSFASPLNVSCRAASLSHPLPAPGLYLTVQDLSCIRERPRLLRRRLLRRCVAAAACAEVGTLLGLFCAYRERR